MGEEILLKMETKIQKALESVSQHFQTVRAGRANPSSLDGVTVSYYGVDTPLKQIATISVPEARQLLIKPFDRTALTAIEKAIFEANLGYTPNNDGETVRIVVPALTEERRVELVKQVKSLAEDGKVTIRNIRRDSLEELNKLKLPEDEVKHYETQIQNLVNDANKKVEEKLKEKEEELLNI